MPCMSFSLISYLQTGAWQGKTSMWEVGGGGLREEGGSEEDLQRGMKGGHATPLANPTSPPLLALSLLHWSGNDRFHSCFRSWRGEVVLDYQGGAWGCDVELRTRRRIRFIIFDCVYLLKDKGGNMQRDNYYSNEGHVAQSVDPLFEGLPHFFTDAPA